jgi:hypothetical protein
MEETTLTNYSKSRVKKFISFSRINGNVIIEAICFLLMLNFFYEGIHKVAYFKNYGFWLTHEPLIMSLGKFLQYSIPIIEISIALLLFKPKYRNQILYLIIILQVVFIFWIMSVYFFTHYLFWPYHAFWSKPTWMQKMGYSLLLSWLAFIAIIIIKKKTLRNSPA